DDDDDDDIPPPPTGKSMLQDRNTAGVGASNRVPINTDDQVDLDQVINKTHPTDSPSSSDSATNASVEDLDQMLSEALDKKEPEPKPQRESTGDSTIVLDPTTGNRPSADPPDPPAAASDSDKPITKKPAAPPAKPAEAESPSSDPFDLAESEPVEDPDNPPLELIEEAPDVSEPPSGKSSAEVNEAPKAPPAESPAAPADPSAVAMRLVDADAKIIRFRFAAELLNNEGFRASMPMRCLVCRSEDRDGLIARPLHWVDSSEIPTFRPTDEQKNLDFQLEGDPGLRTVRQVLERLEPLEGTDAPFHLPMPCFICEQCTDKVFLHASMEPTDQGMEGEVMVPSATCAQSALEWLGRVNGVWSEPYRQLEQKLLELGF
ncbi:MAG: hypothetical protein R3236_06720, partial [Phycisphaeraceae bacterium]|nr:hypothetical protein [Phycisphaeraceae bacterium]